MTPNCFLCDLCSSIATQPLLVLANQKKFTALIVEAIQACVAEERERLAQWCDIRACEEYRRDDPDPEQNSWYLGKAAAFEEVEKKIRGQT